MDGEKLASHSAFDCKSSWSPCMVQSRTVGFNAGRSLGTREASRTNSTSPPRWKTQLSAEGSVTGEHFSGHEQGKKQRFLTQR